MIEEKDKIVRRDKEDAPDKLVNWGDYAIKENNKGSNEAREKIFKNNSSMSTIIHLNFKNIQEEPTLINNERIDKVVKVPKFSKHAKVKKVERA